MYLLNLTREQSPLYNSPEITALVRSIKARRHPHFPVLDLGLYQPYSSGPSQQANIPDIMAFHAVIKSSNIHSHSHSSSPVIPAQNTYLTLLPTAHIAHIAQEPGTVAPVVVVADPATGEAAIVEAIPKQHRSSSASSSESQTAGFLRLGA